jgi:predicted transcriptional regulator/DNA-binding XRE family transcriptional regulator
MFVTMTASSQAHLSGKIRALRRRLALTQSAFAEKLNVSPSYINLIESGRRAVPSDLLLRMVTAFELDLREFAPREESRLVADLVEVFADPLFDDSLSTSDMNALAQSTPHAARSVVKLYRAYKLSQGTTDQLVSQLTDGAEFGNTVQLALPSEEVSDLIQRAENHFPVLEEHAQTLRDRLGTEELFPSLVKHLGRAHGVQVRLSPWAESPGTLRRYDHKRRELVLSELLPTRSRNFEVAHRVGLLELDAELAKIASASLLTTKEARGLCRIALANYFAAAVLMPYEAFLEAAEASRYDIDVLGRKFRVGFEQVCHRLTTLRKPGRSGVPFHMLRIDAAGNISKRFSASGIRFARFSGACVRWNIFTAFQTPGLIRVQVSSMPSGQTFFCIARTVQRESMGYHAQSPMLAIGLGCEVSHAAKLVYAETVQTTDVRLSQAVGVTCRTCERESCDQRAMPSVKVPLQIDESRRGISLYADAKPSEFAAAGRKL